MRQNNIKRYMKYIIIAIISGLAISGLVLLYAQNFGFIGYLNAVSVTSVFMLIIGWFMFAYNHSTFDMLVYGTQQFVKGIFGKRMKKPFIEYVDDKKKIDKIVYRSFWIASIPFFVATIIMFIIYYN